MKKRIFSIVCTVAVIAAMLAVCIVPASAASEAPWGGSRAFKTNGAWTDGIEWTPNDTESKWFSSSSGAFKAYAKNGNEVAIETVNAYDFGSAWRVAMTVGKGNGNNARNPWKLTVGELAAWLDEANGKLVLKKNGETVKEVGIGYVGATASPIPLTLEYVDGTASVSFNGTEFDYEVGTLDFSAAKISIAITDNWTENTVVVNKYTIEKVVTGGASSEPASSEPASSEPASSEPASSEPASSEPASSEPASSEPASSEPASSEPASSEPVSSTAPVAEKVVTAIEGALVAEMWQEADRITDGVAKIAGGASVTLNSVKNYNLGTEWEVAAGYTINGYWDQMAHRPSSIKIGDVEIISTDGKSEWVTDKFEITEDGAITLKIKDVEVQSVPVTYKKQSSKLELRATYKNGVIEVFYSIYGNPEVKAFTYDASDDALDFTDVPVVLYSKADWSTACRIRTFALKTADSVVEPGAPIVVVNEATFNTDDWAGDTNGIIDGGLFSPGKNTNSNKTITSKTAYYLKDGFKFAAKLSFKNSWTNYYGEYASMYVGEAKDGIELRIKNVKDQGMYTGALLVKGEEVATVDLLNAPNGTYELVYKNGKLTVNLNDAAISWTLADKSTATSVAIEDVDLNKVTLGLRIAGNYSSAEARVWSNWSLSPVTGTGSGGTGGTTGDARNLIVPAVALVLGACAVAFVVKSRKANA